jgi:predicted transcriptional regulator
MNGDSLYLPDMEDMLRLIDELRRRAGVTKAQLARVIERDRSAVTKIFSQKQHRGLAYGEAADLLGYLGERLSPLPDQKISSLALPPSRLVKVYAHQRVSAAVKALLKGNFTQVPVYEGERYLGLATDRMILERMLHPNVSDFVGKWVDWLRNMTIKEAEIIETSAKYSPSESLSLVASALTHFYAVMLGEEMKAPIGIVTRWDFLKLLDT